MVELSNEKIENLLKEKFLQEIISSQIVSGQLHIEIKCEHIVEMITYLKNDPSCQFNYLVDIGGIDYLKYPDKPERFAIVYVLQNIPSNYRLVIKTYVPEDNPVIDSITELYAAANWPEREVYDMFGIEFRHHPDLSRILMPDNYEGHPLRKDYPLQGRGERENFNRYETYDPSKK